MVLKEGIVFLEDLGVWDVLLPFLLVFLLIYGILQKTRVFGEEKGNPKNKINAAVAATCGLLVVGFTALVTKIATFVNYLILFIVAGLCIVLVLAFFGRTREKPKNWLLFLIAVVCFFILFSVLNIFAIINTTKLLETLFHPVVIVALVFIGLVYYIVHEKKPRQDDASPRPVPPSSPSPQRPFLPQDQPFRREHIRRIPGNELQDGFFGDMESPDPRRGQQGPHHH